MFFIARMTFPDHRQGCVLVNAGTPVQAHRMVELAVPMAVSIEILTLHSAVLPRPGIYPITEDLPGVPLTPLGEPLAVA